MGGHTENPTYKDVCYNNTGHAEVVAIEYNANVVKYETLLKLFLEIHDFTQINRQGPDIGEQYRTEIFYNTDEQKQISERIIKDLELMGYSVATKVTKASKYWKAENYHQNYYDNKGGKPYCHQYKKIFK